MAIPATMTLTPQATLTVSDGASTDASSEFWQQIAADTEASTAPDVQVSMLGALRDILVARLADDFQEQSEGRIQRWMGEAVLAERKIYALAAERTDNSVVSVDYF